MASVKTRSSKGQEVEASVLAATEDLLTEGHSFAGLGVERIATRAGIGRTAFYFYFRDKRELLMRLAEGVTDQLYAEAEAWWEGEGEDRDDLARAMTRIAALFREHAPLLRAVIEVSTYDDEIGGLWRALVGRFVDANRRRIESEQAAGRVGPIDAHATACSLTWMVERVYYQQIVMERQLDDDRLVDTLTDIYLRAIFGAS
jgi:AcrR family transcriptional regulator